jgi:hypothetical protein
MQEPLALVHGPPARQPCTRQSDEVLDRLCVEPDGIVTANDELPAVRAECNAVNTLTYVSDAKEPSHNK